MVRRSVARQNRSRRIAGNKEHVFGASIELSNDLDTAMTISAAESDLGPQSRSINREPLTPSASEAVRLSAGYSLLCGKLLERVKSTWHGVKI